MKTQFANIYSPRQFKSIQEAEIELHAEPHEHKWLLIKKHAKLREQAIDFMVKACSKYQFKKDTLFLSIKIMDILIK